MNKKIIYFVVFFLLAGILFINSAFSDNIGMKCEGTQYNGVYYKSGRPYYPVKNGVKYRCIACGSCTPISGPQSSSIPYGGGTKQQMQMQMFQRMFQPLFNSLFDFSGPSAPPDTSYQDALRKQQEEELIRQQEEKKQALERWMNLQAEAELKRLQEEEQRTTKGRDILARASITNGDLKMESMGEGKLTRFSWDTPKTFAPVPSGQYDTSKLTGMERLLCAAYFSKMAESAANSGDLERTRFIGFQVDKVMQGFPTEIECKPPKDLSSMADVKKIGELNQKYTKMATLYQEIMPKIEKLQDLETELDEVKKKKEEAEQTIKEIDQRIEDIKVRTNIADTPEKKAQEDDLLSQALLLKSEAENQQQEAVEAEEKLTKEKQNIEDELNTMKAKIQEGGQR